MRLALLSDTHLPVRAKEIPEPVWAAVDAADVVVHAGDWVAPEALDALEARAATLVGCWGNNDGEALRARLPEVARVEVGGLRLAVVHETGDARGRERRCDTWFGPDSDDPVDVVVFGHSHVPWDSTTPRGLRLLNPGSPTDRRRQPFATFMTGVVAGGALTVERHDLPPRVGRRDR
ncbi:YfcE family phosphodiesterase [Actinomycetospora endophytica]|uniref:Phosphoesterase n=1 Tax=Actinomycetospora endophytica TaxID=2291215 RepID=A0ABS8P682_9PSEU|nr:YfcE family phosphodiesterase [Actinomycetospora endophytica]MCD2193055.1 YfcE family phosphodiesterase [Actinomycetospora endophytica]